MKENPKKYIFNSNFIFTKLQGNKSKLQEEVEYQRSSGTSGKRWGWAGTLVTWNIHLSNLITLYDYNECILLYINYTSKVKFKNPR